MIQSMTGFGRATCEVQGLSFAVEVRTVNHRHLDVSLRAPRLAAAAEPALRKRVASCFGRGKVEVGISVQAGTGAAASVELDADLAGAYVGFAEQLRREHGLEGALGPAELLQLPGVARLVEESIPEETLEAALLDAAGRAAEAARAMREVEGQALERELRGRLESVSGLVDALESRTEGVVEAARERLRKRAEQLKSETGLLDEARLHQEVVIAADKLDVNEELVRLRSHVEQYHASLDGAEAGTPVGRRLDFLLQELVREANTVGSKGNDADVAHLVVDLKTELERMREQVQNIE
ncbi:MAG: YicC/YloC family endoribonuclease [Myxococcota bacterium]|nr:YicC/YloC family endoribonuclease [Myxococcota bacterium]